jgi:hypothetical protein
MKKLIALVAFVLAIATANAQNYPSPTYDNVTINKSIIGGSLDKTDASNANVMAAAGAISPRTLAAMAADTLNVKNGWAGLPGVKGDGVQSTNAVTVTSAAPTLLHVTGGSFTSADVGKPIFINGIGTNEFVATGSIAPGSASFTGSISVSLLTVSNLSGTLPVGAIVTGTNVAAGTYVIQVLDPVAGKYVVNINQTVASTAMSATYGTLTITNTTSGALIPGQFVLGSGVASGTIIRSYSGTGTYIVNLTQTVPSETISGTVDDLATTIAAVTSPTDIVLTDPAQNFVTGVKEQITYGTDDSAAFNALIGNLKTTGSQYLTIDVPNGLYVIKAAGLNWTNLNNIRLRGLGATFYGATSGQAVVDMLGNWGDVVDGFHIIGDQFLRPTTGIQFGRINPTAQAFGLLHMSNLNTDGYFSIAAGYNMASETSKYEKLSINNRAPNAYAWINDGINHFGLTSKYVTIGLTPNVPFTFTISLFLSSRFVDQAYGSNAIWVAYMNDATWIGCYSNTIGGASVTIYDNNIGRANRLVFDINNEGPPSYELYFDGGGFTSVVGLKFPQNGNLSTVGFIGVNPAFGAVKVYDLDVSTNGPSVSGNFFDAGALAGFQAVGNVSLSNPFTWVNLTHGFTGCTSIVTVRTCYGVTVPTPAAGDRSLSIANTQFVQNAIGAIPIASSKVTIFTGGISNFTKSPTAHFITAYICGGGGSGGGGATLAAGGTGSGGGGGAGGACATFGPIPSSTVTTTMTVMVPQPVAGGTAGNPGNLGGTASVADVTDGINWFAMGGGGGAGGATSVTAAGGGGGGLYTPGVTATGATPGVGGAPASQAGSATTPGNATGSYGGAGGAGSLGTTGVGSTGGNSNGGGGGGGGGAGAASGVPATAGTGGFAPSAVTHAAAGANGANGTAPFAGAGGGGGNASTTACQAGGNGGNYGGGGAGGGAGVGITGCAGGTGGAPVVMFFES